MYYLADSSAIDNQGHNLEFLLRIREYFPEDTVLLVNSKCILNDKNIRKVFTSKSWDFGRFGFSNSVIRGRQSFNPELPEIFKELIYTILRIYPGFCLGQNRNKLKSPQAKVFFDDLVRLKFRYKSTDTIIFTSINFREINGLLAFLEKLKTDGEEIPNIKVILRIPLTERLGMLDWPFNYYQICFAKKVLKDAFGLISFYTDTFQLRHYFSNLIDRKPEVLQVPGLSENYRKAEKKIKFSLPSNSRHDTRNSTEDLDEVCSIGSVKQIPGKISSREYASSISRSSYVILPYLPKRYQIRSSGIFAESISVNTKPIVPTGTWMSQELAYFETEDENKTHSRKLLKDSFIHLEVTPNLPIIIRLSSSDPSTSIKITINGVTSHHHLCLERNSDEFIYFPGSSNKLMLSVKASTKNLFVETLSFDFARLGYAYFPGQLISLVKFLDDLLVSSEHDMTALAEYFSPDLTALQLIGN